MEGHQGALYHLENWSDSTAKYSEVVQRAFAKWDNVAPDNPRRDLAVSCNMKLNRTGLGKQMVTSGKRDKRSLLEIKITEQTRHLKTKGASQSRKWKEYGINRKRPTKEEAVHPKLKSPDRRNESEKATQEAHGFSGGVLQRCHTEVGESVHRQLLVVYSTIVAL
ncbi:unnamed protein product [Pleuronectes platessa]|uniref:Uncharacterized protein n=1 Tax=Pleuronectes platessa TaxID=8262 RepID=A0A9N7UJI9_PLEPL|nr:unnamed protein product [Pleuronectes platessa]